ncbi:ribosomal maturation YjgA family protein [Asaia astilbis]|uniref:ribosomal maturation YjgA family protein n=1 Tax=Asaia astilbis TaxID=610244 RepID=UPI000470C728|nr:DUF2809 domain-containing protein [Asaia astilbis]
MTHGPVRPGRPTTRQLWHLIATIVIAGLICRLAPLGLDPWVKKWSGSVLWGSLFWCLSALLIPKGSRFTQLALACVAVTGSEILKLVHVPFLDAMRMTSIGSFLLGRHFAWLDLLAYAFGVMAAELTGAAMQQEKKITSKLTEVTPKTGKLSLLDRSNETHI